LRSTRSDKAARTFNFLDAAAKAEERAWLDYMRRLFSDATAKIDAVEQSQ
jgi:hypothetical protein